MAASQQGWIARVVVEVLLVVVGSSHVLVTCKACATYASIFSFGDSLADNGNLYFSSQQPQHHCFSPPYGETYFHHPSGRCSDGRLIIDFIAESLGIPLVKPYMGIKTGKLGDWRVDEGANFAVIGATALDASFFEEKGIQVPTNYSLPVQLSWFKELLPSLCNSSTSEGFVGPKAHAFLDQCYSTLKVTKKPLNIPSLSLLHLCYIDSRPAPTPPPSSLLATSALPTIPNI